MTFLLIYATGFISVFSTLLLQDDEDLFELVALSLAWPLIVIYCLWAIIYDLGDRFL